MLYLTLHDTLALIGFRITFDAHEDEAHHVIRVNIRVRVRILMCLIIITSTVAKPYEH